MSHVDWCRRGCGGKAAELCALQSAGFNVPEFEISPVDLAATVARLGFPLAVRSSATVEDGERSSFAGQFHSYLGLQTLQEVRQAVDGCLASVHSPEVAKYCARHGIAPAEIRMEYLVQRMIEPDLAGVVFTMDPVRGTDELVVNACEGRAGDLLSGSQSPLPADHPALQKHLPRIAAVAREIEQHFGAPQDIEFAIADGVVHVLQARPITRISFAAIDGEWTNANFRDGGVSSGVCSPLMWSLYELIWNASIKRSFQEARLWTGDFEAARMFFGRPYWNLAAVKNSVALVPGFVEREFDEDLGVGVHYEGPGRETPFTFWNALRAVPMLLGTRGFLRRQRRAARRLLDVGLTRIAPQYEKSCPELGQAQAQWRQLIERDYFDVECTYFRSVFAVSLVKQDFKLAFPDCDYSALMAGLPPLRHMTPIRRMRANAPRDAADVAALVREYPHPSRWGLDVRFPRWDEEPEFVEQLWRTLPPSEACDPTAGYEQAKRAALRAIPRLRRRAFVRKLDRLREFVWLREELRDVSTRMYHLIRRQARRLAEQTGLDDDVFYLTYRELLTDDRSQLAARKADFARYRNYRAPNEIGRHDRCLPQPPTGDWRGIAASAGTVSGVARIAHSIDEAARLPAGCILICPFTEPSWTSILDRFAGVVTETGGQLSHAAVLCREFGIPAVLGVPRATQRIPAGTLIVVDGGEGWVAPQVG